MVDDPVKSTCFWAWMQTNNKTKVTKPLYKRVLNFTIFAIFKNFREILYPRKVSKPKNREIK